MLKETCINLGLIFSSVHGAAAQSIDLFYGYGKTTISPYVVDLNQPFFENFIEIDNLAQENDPQGLMIVVDDPERESGGFIGDEYVLVAIPRSFSYAQEQNDVSGVIFRHEGKMSDKCVFIGREAGQFDALYSNQLMTTFIMSMKPDILAEINNTGCLAVERRNIPAPI